MILLIRIAPKCSGTKAPGMHPASAQASASSGHAQCQVSAGQVEELYAKMELPRRARWADWAKSSPPWLRVPKESSCLGQPGSWRVRTLDTSRWVNVRWRPLVLRVLPSLATADELYRLGAFVWERAELAATVLAARWERSGLAEGPSATAVAVQAPISALVALAQAMAAQTDDNDTGTLMKQRWLTEWSLPDELYRSVGMTLFQLRQADPPFILLASVPDNAWCVILCRDGELILGDETVLGMPDWSRPRAPEGAKAVPKYPTEFVSWPILEHASTSEKPCKLCQRPGCLKRAIDGPDDPRVLFTWEQHLGPYEKDRAKLVGKQMSEIWDTEVMPAVRAEATRLAAESGEGEAAVQRIEGELWPVEEKKLQAREAAILEEMEKEGQVKLKQCTRCHAVAYCGADCQKKDWPAHKSVCF